ncbi:EAL domain-containing protein [Lederbergia citrea]|uniref:EAL domain-containing protein n=1 Tax=Lederbergia citrea TaxID=2833581 RepID=UPI001BC94C44|nr:EAL domain-containing protein [Lederbergia citrea]MBS4179162.1 EAL domain-containing protein [Lederbergia citrea]
MVSEEDFHPLINDHLNSVIKLDIEGNLISYNKAFINQFGFMEQDFKKPFLTTFFDNYSNDQKRFFDIALLGNMQTFNTVGLHRDGKPININVKFIPVKTKESTDVYVILKNIADLKEQERELLLFKDNLDKIEGLGNIGTFHYDMINDTTYSSKQHRVILGINEDEDFSPTLKQLLLFIHSDDHPRFEEKFQQAVKNTESGFHIECRIVRRDQTIRHTYVRAEVLVNEQGVPDRVIGFIKDITEQKVLSEKVRHLSYHDYLTNLPNRRMFDEKLQQLTAEFMSKDNKFAVMILDIDRFKYINDTLGHPIGDKVLVQVSARLSKFLATDDLLARLGGDEFGVLIVNLESIESMKKIASSMLDCLKEPFLINEYKLYVTASIGISVFPHDGVNSHELIRNADIALYRVEERGRNNFKVISPLGSIESFKSFSLGRDLIKALENNEMVLYYQPRVDTNTGKIMSAEALIRWEHPEWGLVSPAEFLPLAEENGLMIQIDDWVLKEVCNQMKKWKEEILWTVPISINISAAHFLKQDWLDTIEETIQEAGISPCDLEFEITESSFLNNEEIVKNTIYSLREMGINISLDDFGKGYSSLSSLAQFPFDVIKIDKSFIQNMLISKQNFFIAKSIIHLAKDLHIKVVAEGVETLEHLKVLRNEECYQIQGYLFSRPVPVKEFELLLQKKILKPDDPKMKDKQSQRKYYRINFPYPVAANMRLLAIAGQEMQLGKSSVLIEDMSIGGLRYLSTLKLPVRDDIILEFETQIMNETIQLKGHIIWKEEVNDEISEYGIEFIIDENERTNLDKLLNTFTILMKNPTTLPQYNMVVEDKFQYFRKIKY